MKLNIFYTILPLFFLSCIKSKPYLPKNEKENIPGTFFILKEDNIKLFLPVSFEEFSEETYQELIDSLPNSYDKEIEQKRFNLLKYSKGSTYYFKDLSTSTLLTIKTQPYLKFGREQSAYLLGMLSNRAQEYAEVTGNKTRKITAGYSGNHITNVFKAVYELTNENSEKAYNTLYLISSNFKTFWVHIYSKNQINYNNFIEKIVVN